MCTRYVPPELQEIERAWHIGRHNSDRWPAQMFPRDSGPFLRPTRTGELEVVCGAWGLVPDHAATAKLPYSTFNARSEDAARKPSFRLAWARGQRCIIPARSFDEPCWETGRNVWTTFRRADGQPWGLAGLWNRWTDPASGEWLDTYTMLTVNADQHPVMRRMHKPDPLLPPDRQDKRSVVAIRPEDTARWLTSSPADAAALLQAPDEALFDSGWRPRDLFDF